MKQKIYNDSVVTDILIKKDKLNSIFIVLRASLNLNFHLGTIKVPYTLKEIEQTRNLQELLKVMGWVLILNDDGDCVGMVHTIDDVGEEELMFKAFASFIEDGKIKYRYESYLSDVDVTYTFKNKKLDIESIGCFENPKYWYFDMA